MNFVSKRTRKIICLLTVLCVCTAITYIAYAQAGTEGDPVISLSYLKEVFAPEIREETSFKVVFVESGKTLYGEAGCELVLRMGTADIVATEKGGLCDTTKGSDLADGTAAPSNHHLIVPLGDGRGIRATADCLVMVKGGYKVE